MLHWRGDDPAASIYLSQRDVRELQFAKASIATGWAILVAELGVDTADITQVLLAGSFGAYLTPISAIRIGLVPRLPTDAHHLRRQRRRRGREDRGAAACASAPRRSRSSARSSTSSSRGARTSTTCSSTSSRSPDDRRAPTRVGVVACGALAVHVRAIAERRGWALDVHPLDATLHNRPERIAPAVSELLATLRPRYERARGGLRRLRQLRRARRRAGGQRRRAPRGRELLRDLRRRRAARGARAGAGHLFPDRLPRPQLRAHGDPLARARPPPGAARRLLRPLSPRRLARSAPDARRRAPPPGAPPSCSGCRSRSGRSATAGSSARSSG